MRNVRDPGFQRFTKSMKAIAKRLLPEVVIHEVQQYRMYKKDERALYLKTKILNGTRIRDPKRLRPPQTARSLLFVCFGNIMRSPMCEALMNRKLMDSPHAHITVASAGLNATPGRAAHPWAITAAQQLGIALENHRARLLTAEIVDQADAIFVMDYQNQVQLLSRHPGSREKVFMLSAYAGEGYRFVEIRDPYFSDEEGTRRCYEILNTCISNLIRSLALESKSENLADSQVPKIKS